MKCTLMPYFSCIEKGKLSFGIASNSLTFGDLEFIYVIAAYCVIHRHGEKALCSESSGNIIVFLTFV